MMPTTARLGWRATGLVVCMALLSACGNHNDEVQEWMDGQAKQVKARVDPISPPVKFVPKLYEPGTGIEPFGAAKLVSGSRPDAARASALMDAELRRRREPLEAFPLDSISMVGSLNKGNQRFALVRAEQLLYYVKVGDYLGQNFGKITNISETEVALREVVEDASGEWTERASVLHIK
jgi:type IV pilus assembly protein PilP